MRAIRYSLHFRLLIMAGVLFWLAKEFDLASYGLMGALHATALVLSLRSREPRRRVILAFTFIILAATWSAATFIVALWSSKLWNLLPNLLGGDLHFILILVTGSAAGSAGYWLLVRMFWLKSLGGQDCLRTMALCVAATLVSLVLALRDQSGKDYYGTVLFTVAWWFAFSLSLYWSEVSGLAKNPTRAMANV